MNNNEAILARMTAMDAVITGALAIALADRTAESKERLHAELVAMVMSQDRYSETTREKMVSTIDQAFGEAERLILRANGFR